MRRWWQGCRPKREEAFCVWETKDYPEKLSRGTFLRSEEPLWFCSQTICIAQHRIPLLL